MLLDGWREDAREPAVAGIGLAEEDGIATLVLYYFATVLRTNTD